MFFGNHVIYNNTFTELTKIVINNIISYQSIYRCGNCWGDQNFKRTHTKSCTERGGSVLTHETRIREVPGSNPVADQPG